MYYILIYTTNHVICTNQLIDNCSPLASTAKKTRWIFTPHSNISTPRHIISPQNVQLMATMTAELAPGSNIEAAMSSKNPLGG